MCAANGCIMQDGGEIQQIFQITQEGTDDAKLKRLSTAERKVKINSE